MIHGAVLEGVTGAHKSACRCLEPGMQRGACPPQTLGQGIWTALSHVSEGRGQHASWIPAEALPRLQTLGTIIPPIFFKTCDLHGKHFITTENQPVVLTIKSTETGPR